VEDQQRNMIRIGELLVKQGAMTEQQVFEVVQAQKNCGLPFGVLAERMFDVTVESVEQAWIEQYAGFTGALDIADETVDRRVLGIINRRQAWQFEMLPLRFEPSGELLVAASKRRLARAVTFAARRIEPIVFFRVVESEALRQFLQQYYPLPEVSEEILRMARDLAHDEEAALAG